MLGVVEHGLGGHHGGARWFLEEVAAGVEVAVPLREIASRDRDAQPVAGGDAYPNRAERDVVAIDRSGSSSEGSDRLSR